MFFWLAEMDKPSAPTEYNTLKGYYIDLDRLKRNGKISVILSTAKIMWFLFPDLLTAV